MVLYKICVPADAAPTGHMARLCPLSLSFWTALPEETVTLGLTCVCGDHLSFSGSSPPKSCLTSSVTSVIRDMRAVSNEPYYSARSFKKVLNQCLIDIELQNALGVYVSLSSTNPLCLVYKQFGLAGCGFVTFVEQNQVGSVEKKFVVWIC